MAMRLTPMLWTPATWYEGKHAAIEKYIDPVRRPMLVAGDSPSDHPMLFYSDVPVDGVRLWVTHSDKNTQATHDAIDRWSRLVGGDNPTMQPAHGWLFVSPAELGDGG